MTTTLIVLDGHMMDYMVEGADDLLLQSLNIDPSSEYLMVDAVEWERLADLCRHRGLLPTMMVGGAGANTARWFGRLGGQVQVYGQVGQDENGRTHLAQLSRDLCDVRVRQVAQPTGRSLVLVRPNGGRVMRSDIGGGMYFDDEATVKAGIQPNTWLHLTGYLLNQAFPIHRVAFAAMETATDLHVPISIDLGSGAYLGREIMRQVIERYNATVLFLNHKEAEMLGLGAPEQAARQLLDWTTSERGAVVVVTQGERGVLVHSAGEHFTAPARQVVVRDTTGAGDAMAAGFLLSLTRGSPLRACADYGCKVAAETVQVLGGLPANDNL
mgnify:FL=1